MANELFEFVSDYEYVLGDIEGKALRFQGIMMDTQPVYDEMVKLSINLEQTAKAYASVFSKTYNLHDHIKGRIYNASGNKKTVALESNATAPHNKGYYGGHVEYGHKDRGGGFTQAKPYMRPAIHTISEWGNVDFAAAIGRAFNQIFYFDNPLLVGSKITMDASKDFNKSEAAKFGRKSGYVDRGKLGEHLRSHFGTRYESMRAQYSVERGSKGGVAGFGKSGEATKKIDRVR